MFFIPSPGHLHTFFSANMNPIFILFHLYQRKRITEFCIHCFLIHLPRRMRLAWSSQHFAFLMLEPAVEDHSLWKVTLGKDLPVGLFLDPCHRRLLWKRLEQPTKQEKLLPARQVSGLDF